MQRRKQMASVQQGQEAEQQMSRVWLAADYHFPSTYSCRIPMSSMNSASVMPAPGPATVRLALLRTGIELFGLNVVRDELFPILRSATVRTRPPERVAISQQRIRGYKWSEDRQKRETIQESIIVREMAHARGPMTVFLQVPLESEQRMHRLLRAIGYWGQSSSLASCLGVTNMPPVPGECAMPLALHNRTLPLRPFFTCPVTEFRSDQLAWDEIVPGDGTPKTQVLRLELYVWPMITDYRHGTEKLLVRSPLFESGKSRT
jgi:hypothetical protein